MYTLITGASEGLGKCLAFECAKRNMNLILVALPDSGLVALGDFIKRNFSVSVSVIEMDLTNPRSCYELYEEVQKQNLQVQILINNAGIGNTIPFREGSAEYYEKLIKLNVLATTIITRLFLSDLERNKPSYILNVGSLASFFYLPKKHVYGSSKSYIHFFTMSLRQEIGRDGICACVLCPGGINTNMSVSMLNRSGSGISRLAVMDPEKVAEIAITGLLNGKQVIIPGIINNFFIVLKKLLPGIITNMITNHGMRKLKTGRHYSGILVKETSSPVAINKVA
jgi:short-subunit dehydrogenase